MNCTVILCIGSLLVFVVMLLLHLSTLNSRIARVAKCMECEYSYLLLLLHTHTHARHTHMHVTGKHTHTHTHTHTHSRPQRGKNRSVKHENCRFVFCGRGGTYQLSNKRSFSLSLSLSLNLDSRRK